MAGIRPESSANMTRSGRLALRSPPASMALPIGHRTAAQEVARAAAGATGQRAAAGLIKLIAIDHVDAAARAAFHWH
jgi:hypothetical protein